MECSTHTRNGYDQKETHIIDLVEWVDPTALSIVSPPVGPPGDVLQQRGEDWNGNKINTSELRLGNAKITNCFVGGFRSRVYSTSC